MAVWHIQHRVLEGSISSKNVLINSSGLGVAFSVWVISFDVVSHFTAIPVDKACTYIRTKLAKDDILSDRTQLDTDDILRLLQFVLSNSFFVYNNITYKQIHGCAMGSPVSTIVANLCME